jgi:hypothetical protein
MNADAQQCMLIRDDDDEWSPALGNVPLSVSASLPNMAGCRPIRRMGCGAPKSLVLYAWRLRVRVGAT